MRARVYLRNPILLCAIVLMVLTAFVGAYRSTRTGEIRNSAGINEQLNFQARLLTGTGAVVPDGFYNLRFKVYQDGDGCETSGSSPCGGTLLWTETRDSTNKVRVKNGYFSVYLGSVNPFSNSVDWNQDTLWLSIDVGGTGGSPSWDGEMLPFSRFSATPYAKNAKRIGGLTKDEIVQLGQNAIQVDSSTNDSIAINKTGASGDILQLQRGGSDVLLITNSGSLLFKPQTNSTTAFRVQNAAGTGTVINADTTNQRVGINNSSPGASLQVQGASASEIVSIIQGNSSTQTGDLQRYLNSSSEVMGRVDAGGNIVAALDPPSAALTAAVSASAGNLNGTYTYVVTYTTFAGETYAGPASTSVAPTSDQVDLTNIPTGPAGTKSRKIYRTTRQVDGVTTNWRFLTEIADNTTTIYTDNTADTGLTYSPPMPIAPPQTSPVVSTDGGSGSLSGIYGYRYTYITPWGETPAGPLAGAIASSNTLRLNDIVFGGVNNVTAVRMYRTEANGSTYYYNPSLLLPGTLTSASGTITDPGVVTRDDNASDGTLNTNIVPPTSANTANQPAAPSASLITSAGNLTQSSRYTWAYSYVNASGAESALSPMSGTVTPDGTGQQVSVTGITAGPPGTVARKIYRTNYGAYGFYTYDGPFLLVGTIADNTTTTYTDNTADNQLTVNRPKPTGFVGSGIVTNNIKLAAPQGAPPIEVTSTTMVKNLNVELLGGNDQQGIKDFTYNMDESLKKFRGALANAQSEPVVVNFIGDSITWGLASSDRAVKSTPALVESALKEKYGDGGTGFQKPYDNRLWTQGSNGTYTLAAGAAGGALKMCNAGSNTASLSINFRGSKVAIQYTDATTSGYEYDTFDYSVDNGAVTGTVSANTQTLQFGKRVVIDDLDPQQTHTVTITVPIDGGVSGDECVGIEGIDAMFDQGIRVNNLATSSQATWSTYHSSDAAIGSFDPRPDLVVFAYGTNEQGSSTTPLVFKAYYQRWISQAKASSDPADCVLVVPAPQTGDDSARFEEGAYRDVIYQLADENGCGVLDLWRKWGGDFTWAQGQGFYNNGLGGPGTVDGLHLSDKGAADVASSLINFLDRGVKLNNSLSVDTSYAQNGGSFSITELATPQNLVDGNNKQVADGTLTSGNTYRYQVTALNSSGESLPSSEEVFTVKTGNGLTADNIISMRWDVVPGATKYRLYRCPSANCVSGTTLSQYVETARSGIVDDGTLSWVTNVTPPSSSGNSSFAGALLQGSSTSAFNVANSDSASVVKVDTSPNPYNLIANSGFESDSATNILNNPSFESESINWAAKGSGGIGRDGTYVYDKSKSLVLTTTAVANDGAKYNIKLPNSKAYELTFWARTAAGSGSVLAAGYANDGSTESNCSLNSTSISTSWAQYSCIVTTTTVSGTSYLYIKQTDATARYIVVDKLSFKPVTEPNGWDAKGSTSRAHQTDTQKYAGNLSMKADTTAAAGDGIKYPITLSSSTQYSLSFKVRASSLIFGTLAAGYASDGSTETDCTLSNTVAATTGWFESTCTFTTGTVSGAPYLYIEQTDATARSIYIDAISLVPGATPLAYTPGSLALNGTITSPLLIRNTEDSNTALQVQNAAGTTLFNVNTALSSVNVTGTLAVTGGATVSANLTANSINVGSSSSLVNSTLEVVDTFDSTDSCGLGCTGIYVLATADNPSAPTGLVGIRAGVATSAASFTLTSAYGLWIDGAVEGSGSTITNAYGLFVGANTAAANNYGAVIQASSTQTLWIASDQSNPTTAAAGVAFGSNRDVTLYRGGSNQLKTDDNLLVQTLSNSAVALEVEDSSAQQIFAVDTTARSGSGGNLVKIGNSTGTDTDTTIFQLDAATADPTSNLSALNGGLFYNSTSNKVSIIENGVVKVLCNTTDAGCGAGGSGARLDQVSAATAGASINNADNNIVWNWQLTGAESGFTFTENAASTGGGTQNQFLTDIATLSGSTASPLRVTSASVDAADIVYNLASNGDIEFQDNGTAFMTLSDAGAYSYTLDATDNPTYTITNSGSGNITTNLAGTGDYVVQDNGSAVFTIADTGTIDTALTSTSTTAGDEYSLKVTVSDTGVVTTGTDNTYAERIAMTRTGATGGTINSYGLDVLNNADSASTGTATAYGISAYAAGAATGSTADYLYGVRGGATAVLGGNVTLAVGVKGEVGTFLYGGTITEAAALQGHLNIVGAGTVTEGYGLQIASAAINAATITDNYGVKIEAQTVGASDYGIAIDAAETQTVWISSNANNTTASAGIAFGSSRDTNLYRSDVATLKTDGSFQVGSATSSGNVSVYGDITREGVAKQTSLANITDIYIYDTTRDSDGGAWTNSAVSQQLSWYTEAKDDGYGDACNISSDDRCDGSRFPSKAIIASTPSAVYIFDASDYTMFMKFTQSGTYALGADSNNNPSGVFATNGVVYVGTNGSSGSGLYAIDFARDRLFNYNSTDRDQGDKNIANRNSTVTYSTNSITGYAIANNAVNDVHGAVISGSGAAAANVGSNQGATIIVAATDSGASVINTNATKVIDYGDNLTDDVNQVWLTSKGRLFLTNETLAQVERYNSVEMDTADQATPDDIFDEQAANLPNLAKTAPTISTSPDAMYVTERASAADGNYALALGTVNSLPIGDVIYVGHSLGLTEIHDVGVPGTGNIGWSKFYSTTTETGYMSGTPRGMFTFDNASGDITDASIRNNVLESKGTPTYRVNGVHGMGMSFNGSSQYACSDANNDATCDTDADYDPGTLGFTVELWFKHSTSIAGTDTLIDHTYNTTPALGAGYRIYMNSTGNIVAGIDDDATAFDDDIITGTGTFNDGQWHHLVFERVSTAFAAPNPPVAVGAYLYVDGKLIGSDTTIAATATLNSSAILGIGAVCSVGAACSTGANFWDGQIDDVYISMNGATTSDSPNGAGGAIAKRYSEGKAAMLRPSTEVTDATAVSSTTIGDSGSSFVPNEFVGSIVEITSGTGAGQTRRIVANDATTFTVSPAWTTTPDATSDYEVMPEQLYGATNSVTSVAVNDTDFLGRNPNLLVGTSDGSDGGGVTVLSGYGTPSVSDVYHGNAGITDDSGTAWSATTDYDDVQAIESRGGVVSIGSLANAWVQRDDRSIDQSLDQIFSNISSIRQELIADTLQANSSVGGTLGADLAERFTSFDELVAGEIVSMKGDSVGEVTRTAKPYDDKTLGIVATAPGLIIGPQEDNSYPIALSGRVPVRVVLRPGERIKSGDRITSSEVPGYGMKAVNAGRVVGAALEDLTEDKLSTCPEGTGANLRCGTITVFVNLVDYNGQKVEVAIEEFGNGGFTMPETVLGPLVNLQEGVLDEKLKESDEIIRYLIGRKAQQPSGALGENTSEILTDRVSSYEINGVTINAKEINADSIKANKIEGLEVLVGKLTSRPKTATDGSSDNDLTEASVNLDDFVVKTAKVGEDLTVNGSLFANGALEVVGPVEFLSTSIFHRMATFVDSVIFRSDVEIQGRLTQNNDAAGFAVIYETQKKVEVKFDKPYEDVPVVTVNVKNGKFVQYAYDDLTEEGFTIVIPEAATEDIEFSWSAISVKDARTIKVPINPTETN